jgi:micrococcal nuclease
VCPFIDYSTVVSRVIDGDTVCLSDGSYVRLIGIDSPERDEEGYYGSTEYLTKLVLGKEVRVKHQTTWKDKYGRELYDIYLDDRHVNLMIVEQGWAKAFAFGDNTKFATEILHAEVQAREENRGIFE